MGTSAEKNDQSGEGGFSQNKTTDISEKDNNNSIMIEDKKEQNEYCKTMLQTHNNYREKHKSNKLRINEDLNAMANKYAKYLLENYSFGSQNKFGKDESLGENIFFSNQKEKETDICQKWYDENKNFEYGINKFQKDTNHFTQLIWNSTTDVGFGFYNINNNYCYVALYYPQGNVFGQFTKNVFMPIS